MPRITNDVIGGLVAGRALSPVGVLDGHELGRADLVGVAFA
jgi:hypothetical protein